MKRNIKAFLGTVLARREKESGREGETKKIVKGIQKAKTFPSAESTDQELEMDSLVWLNREVLTQYGA